ncbi:MAG: hypothetical protein HY906_20610 [Deltaproteobacteria bacterium]|nr:hypothetical protein [Deltaproteobacteria bacterium]
MGYAYQYGIGVRGNARAAKATYRAAIRSKTITEFGKEEAEYHLAVLLLDEGGRTNVVRARELLGAASADGDYPVAARVLHRLEHGLPPDPWRCRRGLRRTILGQAWCPHHVARGQDQGRDSVSVKPAVGRPRPR